MLKALKYQLKSKSCYQIVTVDKSVTEKNLVKATKYLKELDKAFKVHSKPINPEKDDPLESEHHMGASHYFQGRMVKFKDLEKEPSRPFPSQFHHVDMSKVREEKLPDKYQECNKYKFVMRWSIDHIKRQIG